MKSAIKKRFPLLYEKWLDYQEDKYLANNRKMSLADQQKHLSDIYFSCVGRYPNFENPLSYTEKIQWSKFYDRNPLKSILADKYLAKEWVSNCIGNQYVVPLLGVYDRFDDIDFDRLPSKFVLKTNHYSGTNVIIENKDTINKKELRKKFNKWMRKSVAYQSFELHYAEIKPKIIAEQFLESKNGIIDEFQFFCFDGKPAYFWRLNNSIHTKNIYNMDFELQSWNTASMLPNDSSFELPKCMNELISVAEKLSAGLQQVRVDLYLIDEKIYFGEMTFTSGSGLVKYIPDEIDYWLGSKWKHRKINC